MLRKVFGYTIATIGNGIHVRIYHGSVVFEDFRFLSYFFSLLPCVRDYVTSKGAIKFDKLVVIKHYTSLMPVTAC